MVTNRLQLVVVSLAVLCCLPIAAQTPEEAFGAGNRAYEEGDFDAAAEAYRRVLRYKIHDPRVEYNLGNAEFKRGNLGRAILHFERARRLDPTDADTLANLGYVRGFTFDQVSLEAQSALVESIQGIQDRVGADRQAWSLLLLLWIVCGVLVLGLARPGSFSPTLGWSLATLVLLVGIVAASWYATHQRVEGRRLAVVLVDVVDVVAGPGVNNATLATVHEGLTVEIRGDVREEWVQVSLPNGLNGWVPLDAVGFV